MGNIQSEKNEENLDITEEYEKMCLEYDCLALQDLHLTLIY